MGVGGPPGAVPRVRRGVADGGRTAQRGGADRGLVIPRTVGRDGRCVMEVD